MLKAFWFNTLFLSSSIIELNCSHEKPIVRSFPWNNFSNILWSQRQYKPPLHAQRTENILLITDFMNISNDLSFICMAYNILMYQLIISSYPKVILVTPCFMVLIRCKLIFAAPIIIRIYFLTYILWKNHSRNNFLSYQCTLKNIILSSCRQHLLCCYRAFWFTVNWIVDQNLLSL